MPQMDDRRWWKIRKPTSKPNSSVQSKARVNSKAVDHLSRPITPVPPPPGQFRDTVEPPKTPIKQMIPPASTPTAPGNRRKRRLSEANAEDDITLDTPPSRLLEIITATEIFEPTPYPITPQRPQSTLRKQGLAVFSSGTKTHEDTSQAFIQQNEGDPSTLGRLSSLVDRGRRAGGSPSYTFKRGRSRVRYEYMSTQDEEHQSADESYREKRRDGSPLSKRDTKSLREMFFRPSHIPEGIDFDI